MRALATNESVPLLVPVKSVMHAHILQVIAARCSTSAFGISRLVDVGCGDGAFLAAVSQHLEKLSGIRFELHGFDVSDRAVQERDDYFDRTIAFLEKAAPGPAWKERLVLSTSTDPWPHGDRSVDVVTSNQVLEHVDDLRQFFEEHARVLRPGGIGVHVFPLRCYVPEGHVGLPFAHRFRSWEARREFLQTFGRLSRMAPRAYQRDRESLQEFAESRADYLSFETCYRSWGEIERIASQAGLRASYQYCADLYLLKVAYLKGQSALHLYPRSPRRAFVEWLGFVFARYLASITLVVERPPL